MFPFCGTTMELSHASATVQSYGQGEMTIGNPATQPGAAVALHGVVRRWGESTGQVFVDGALWRARDELTEAGEEVLREGDSVVVERVNGLTLSVRRAEEWELIG